MHHSPLLLQLVIILAVARGCGLLLRHVGQPPVIGEMAAGLVLGPIVFGAWFPQFHAMAWGLPYAALMAGSDLLMPDRFLQPEPLATFIDAARPTMAGAVPTVWAGLLAHLDASGARSA